jgi:hypothetical protein
MEIFYGDENSELASFSAEINEIDYVKEHNKNKLNVNVVTLDTFFTTPPYSNIEEIDLIKIDTEGFEYEVLIGAQSTIKKFNPKFIQIEYNWHQLFKSHSLYSLGNLLPNYCPYQLLPFNKGMAKRDLKDPISNIYAFSNFIFIRKDLTN